MKYDIHNPTPAARVIYDGIPKNGVDGPQGVYHFPAGASRTGIELSDSIADELIQRTKGDGKHDADLRLKPCESRDNGEATKKPADKPVLGLKK